MKRVLNLHQNGTVERLGVVKTKDDIMKLLCLRFGMYVSVQSFNYLNNFIRYYITEER